MIRTVYTRHFPQTARYRVAHVERQEGYVRSVYYAVVTVLGEVKRFSGLTSGQQQAIELATELNAANDRDPNQATLVAKLAADGLRIADATEPGWTYRLNGGKTLWVTDAAPAPISDTLAASNIAAVADPDLLASWSARSKSAAVL